jgi:hypothetical protein
VLRFPAVHARFVRVRITAGIVLNTITVGTKKEVQKLPPLLQELTVSR